MNTVDPKPLCLLVSGHGGNARCLPEVRCGVEKASGSELAA